MNSVVIVPSNPSDNPFFSCDFFSFQFLYAVMKLNMYIDMNGISPIIPVVARIVSRLESEPVEECMFRFFV